MRIHLSAASIALSLGWILAFCAGPASPAAVPSTAPQPVSTSTAFPTATPTPVPSATALPSATAAPTAPLSPIPIDLFNNFEEVSGRCLIRSAFGTVPPGATVEEEVLIDSTIGGLNISLSWQEGDLDLALVQPDGMVIDPAAAEKDRVNLAFASQAGSVAFFIRGPQSGTWRARISGRPATDGETRYMLAVDASTATIFSMNFDQEEYSPGEAMKLTASIEDSISDSPQSPEYIYGVNMIVTVEDPAARRSSFQLLDDGLHGDGQAGDGNYANTYGDTTGAGIYKFLFEISGLNNRAGEPFTRECFLANTVQAGPTQANENKVCKGKIEASEPVVVRAEGEGGSDRCDTCRYALSPKAAWTNAGILVAWELGFNGQEPEPNAYMRLLDGDLHPDGESNLLFERNWTGQSASLMSIDGGAALTYCGRYPGSDRLTTAFLDPYGKLVSEAPHSPADPACGAWRGDPAWAGSGGLSAWISRFDVLLDVLEGNGHLLARKTVRDDGLDAPQLAAGHGRVLLAVPSFTNLDPLQSHLAVHRFDLEGNEQGGPVTLEPLTYEVDRQIAVGNFKTPWLVPTEAGWLLVAASGASGRYVAQLSPDGTPVTGLEILDKGMDFPNGFEDVIPYRGGAALLGQLYSGEHVILILSADGKVSQAWQEKPGEGAGVGDLLEYQGRLFWTYTSLPDSGKSNSNQVLTRELRCGP